MAKASYHIALHTSQRVRGGKREGGGERERGEGEGQGEKEDGKNLPNFCNVKFLHSFYSQVMANNICSTLFKNRV